MIKNIKEFGEISRCLRREINNDQNAEGSKTRLLQGVPQT